MYFAPFARILCALGVESEDETPRAQRKSTQRPQRVKPFRQPDSALDPHILVRFCRDAAVALIIVRLRTHSDS